MMKLLPFYSFLRSKKASKILEAEFATPSKIITFHVLGHVVMSTSAAENPEKERTGDLPVHGELGRVHLLPFLNS